jgi:O-methyltransferase domain/Dimerisation domain
VADEARPPAAQLTALVDGFWLSQSLYVVARLGIADLLGAGPHSADELARAVGAHAPSLYRILRALASVGVFAETDDRRFQLTPMADHLRGDAPKSHRFLILNRLRAANWRACGALLHSGTTGESAFRHVHGVGWWDYLEQHPEESRLFDAGMRDIARAVAAAAVDAYDIGAAWCVVDVGGGRGELLAAILCAHPHVRGILFDQPHVVVGGSFFEAVPGGGDLYVLQHILHNWRDEDAVRILAACRKAAGESSKLLLIEGLITPGNAFDPFKLRDLIMLASFDGARERTEREYAALLGEAGFRATRTIRARADEWVLEAVPTG